MSQRWPNTFIVGAGKAGTTSMQRYLEAHPDVYMCPVNEPHFFTRTWELEAEDLDEAIEDYLALFEEAGNASIRAEKSPSYLVHPPVAQRIHEHVPEARIIVMLRDPVERAYSHFLHRERNNPELDDFMEAVLQDVGLYHVLPPGERLRSYFFGDLRLFGHMGLYADQVERYVEVFGHDQVQAVPLTRFKTDASSVLEDVASFLDVDPDPLVALEAESHNVYRGPRNDLAKFLRTDPRAKKVARALVPLRLREWIGDDLLMKRGDKPAMDPEDRRRLEAYYRPDLDRLEAVLGEPLPELREGWITTPGDESED